MTFVANNNGNGNGFNFGNGASATGAGNEDINTVMGGRSTSLCKFHMSGVRVAGDLTYIPAHIKGTERNSQRLIIPVMANKYRSGKANSFKMAVWGGMADVLAKTLSKGRAMDFDGSIDSYLAPLYNQDGSIRLDNQGQQIAHNQIVFTIRDFNFGEESQKTIQAEVAMGMRGPQWNVRGTSDYQAWMAEISRRTLLVWNGEPQFGYARVVNPGGQIDVEVYQALAAKAQAKLAASRTQPAATSGGFGTNGTMNNIRKTFGGNSAPAFGAPAGGFGSGHVQPVAPTPAPAFGGFGAGNGAHAY